MRKQLPKVLKSKNITKSLLNSFNFLSLNYVFKLACMMYDYKEKKIQNTEFQDNEISDAETLWMPTGSAHWWLWAIGFHAINILGFDYSIVFVAGFPGKNKVPDEWGKVRREGIWHSKEDRWDQRHGVRAPSRGHHRWRRRRQPDGGIQWSTTTFPAVLVSQLSNLG